MADESRVSAADSSENMHINEDTDSIDTQGSKKRKAMTRRSEVWNHFETSKEIGVNKAKCKYCKKVLGASTLNGTTGLHQHLNLRCKQYPPNMGTNQAIIDLTQKDGASTGYWKYDPEVARMALLEMVIVDELPFSFVEKEGFRKFMSKVQPLFHVPSRRTLTRDCYTLYGQERQSLKNYFRDVQAKVCLTTDTWTSVQRINYMCLTAHFIDRDWVLDPRNKFVYVDLALDEMYDMEVATKIRDDTKTYLTSLFGEYASKYSTGTITPQSPPSSSSEASLDTSSEDVGLLRNKLHVKRQNEDSGSVGAKSELEKYLNEDQEPFNKNFNVLGWWKINAPRFPILSELARDVLAIPISSVASECAFSTGGRILDQFRSSLTPKLVQSLICLQDWLRSEPLPINVEEDLDYLEQIEMEIASSGRDSSIVDV